MIRNEPHPGVLLADLHVHTRFSPSATFRALDARDSYSEPEAVYGKAKERGMDLVTFTDHDTIEGCLSFLDRHGEQPDFFVSEEVETYLPDFAGRIHVNVFDLGERHHREIQKLRPDMWQLLPYLKQEGLCFSLNHIFRCSPRDRARMDGLMDRLLWEFDCFEVLNGSQQKSHNEFWQAAVSRWRADGKAKAFVGGSDAHTLRRIGTTYTGAPARDKAGFLRAIREGRTFVEGAHGHFFSTAYDTVEVILRYAKDIYIENQQAIPLPRRVRHMLVAAPLLALSGAITAVSTAVMIGKQTKMIRALSRGSREGKPPEP